VTRTAVQSAQLFALLTFGNEMIALSQSLGFQTVAYGSLAYLAHTGDPTVVLADIDLLVTKGAFAALMDRINADAMLRCAPTTYHSLKVFRGKLKVSFDSQEDYLDSVPFERQPVDVGGFPYLVIDRTALIEVYRRGAATIPVKREAYLAKIAGLTVSSDPAR